MLLSNIIEHSSVIVDRSTSDLRSWSEQRSGFLRQKLVQELVASFVTTRIDASLDADEEYYQ